MRECKPLKHFASSVPDKLVVKIINVSESAVEDDQEARKNSSNKKKESTSLFQFLGLRRKRKYRSAMTPKEVRDEAYMLRRCGGHPNVLEVIDFKESPEKAFLVSEQFNCDLEHIDAFALTPYQVGFLTCQMLLALEHIHSRNVVHRDIKPANFFVSSRDISKSTRVVLADFGLATKCERNTQGLSESCGSLLFFAPEVIRGKYGKLADIWSLGVTVFVLLQQALPFIGKDDRSLAAAILAGRYTIVRYPGVTDETVDFLRRLLVADPARRLSASEALLHPFVAPHLSTLSYQLLPRNMTPLQSTLNGCVIASPPTTTTGIISNQDDKINISQNTDADHCIQNNFSMPSVTKDKEETINQKNDVAIKPSSVSFHMPIVTISPPLHHDLNDEATSLDDASHSHSAHANILNHNSPGIFLPVTTPPRQVGEESSELASVTLSPSAEYRANVRRGSLMPAEPSRLVTVEVQNERPFSRMPLDLRAVELELAEADLEGDSADSKSEDRYGDNTGNYSVSTEKLK